MKSEHIGNLPDHQSVSTFQQRPHFNISKMQAGMIPVTNNPFVATNLHPSARNILPPSGDNILSRMPCPPSMNIKTTPTKVQLSSPTRLQGVQQTALHITSPFKLGIGAPTKLKGSTPNKTKAMGKSPMKKENMKSVGGGKSPAKTPGKLGLVKSASTVTSASNVAYKEWKNKFGSQDDQGFHCNMCPEQKTFTADSSLRRHYTQSHEQICKTCKMEFSEEHLLQQHYQEKHEFKCLICSKVFTAFSSVRRHHEQTHPGEALPKGETPIKSEVSGLGLIKLSGKLY
jgi:hypothetical protein